MINESKLKSAANRCVVWVFQLLNDGFEISRAGVWNHAYSLCEAVFSNFSRVLYDEIVKNLVSSKLCLVPTGSRLRVRRAPARTTLAQTRSARLGNSLRS